MAARDAMTAAIVLRTTLAYPGNMADAQNAALALHEIGSLDSFVTTFCFRRDSALARGLALLPGERPKRALEQLARRSVDLIPANIVRQHPYWEIVRMIQSKAGANPTVVDGTWDRMSRSFDKLVAERYVPHVEAVQAFEYTALASFRCARQLGVARALHIPSLDSREFENIQRREKDEWPELRSEYDPYFDAKFERRYERRLEEIALADVIIANSALTARSHIAAGADPSKVHVAMLGAPSPIDEAEIDATPREGPLRVVWAGPFSIRKGAHYLLRAWRRLDAGAHAALDVYGKIVTPQRLLASCPEGVAFHGSVPRATLFAAYRRADVLVFPTLSDGFGMVVVEAFANGLPVITTDQAGSAALVTKENGLVVPAGDSAALAAALQWCLDNRDRLQTMRFAALESARRRQWTDFRRDLTAALATGYERAGYSKRTALRARPA